MIRRKVEQRVASILLKVDSLAYEQETLALMEAWKKHLYRPELFKEKMKQLQSFSSPESAYKVAAELHADISRRRDSFIKSGEHQKAAELEPLERRLFYSREHHKSMIGQPLKLSMRRKRERALKKLAKLKPVGS